VRDRGLQEELIVKTRNLLAVALFGFSSLLGTIANAGNNTVVGELYVGRQPQYRRSSTAFQ